MLSCPLATSLSPSVLQQEKYSCCGHAGNEVARSTKNHFAFLLCLVTTVSTPSASKMLERQA
jgi:hypothetical protein